MVTEPVPVGATVIEPPAPVFMVAVELAAVSTLIVRFALADVPELMAMTLAPALASTVPPLLKLSVGELTVRAAPDGTVVVPEPNEMDAPAACAFNVTVPVLAPLVAAFKVWLPVKLRAFAPPADIRMESVPLVAVVLVVDIVPVPLTVSPAVLVN